MRIQKLIIRQALGLQEQEFSPGKVNLITGGNETGKTSVLECIEKLFCNDENRREKFTRTGADQAIIQLTTDEGMEITRKVKQGETAGTAKVLTSGSKTPMQRPETFLKSLTGEFSLNPVDFMQLSDREQTERLLKLIPARLTKEQVVEWFGEVPAGLNLERHALLALADIEQHYYASRTEANRKTKSLRDQVEAATEQLPKPFDLDAAKALNIKAMWDKVREAEAHNQKIETASGVKEHASQKLKALLEKKQAINQVATGNCETALARLDKEEQGHKDEIGAEIAALEKKIAGLRERLTGLAAQYEQKKAAARTAMCNEIERETMSTEAEISTCKAGLIEAEKILREEKTIDIAPLSASAEQAETIKGYIPIAENRLRITEEHEKAATYSESLTQKIETARAKPAEIIASLEMPIKGLGIAEGVITIEGLPIKNLSTSKQIRLALDIARATSGPAKLILVDKFETLDDEQQTAFLEAAKGDEYQYFVTEVGNGPLKMEVIA